MGEKKGSEKIEETLVFDYEENGGGHEAFLFFQLFLAGCLRRNNPCVRG